MKKKITMIISAIVMVGVFSVTPFESTTYAYTVPQCILDNGGDGGGTGGGTGGC
ncbi:hypothetical protein ACFO3D_02845 [Virgibacillus kekensis]|uniref:Uncharacterized protein n=1 Tax=Virgibacillus kekensis TaxID=202261 RepID=A0ABV9DH65_9BACI